MDIDRIFGSKIRPCGQADIPEWTGKPSSPYDDPRALRFLGEPILPPESNEDLDGGSIGKRRQDDCNCQFPGSIACVRFHVTEKKIELKRELGSAFYEMRLDRIGENLALVWTKDEERKFNTTIQKNLPSSKHNFWDKLLAVFRSKGREGLVSYYHNVFQVRRRAYQNRLAPNAADSDDDSIEPGFLYLLQGGRKSRSRSAASSGNRKNY
ncbi:AT-rich interactive domain-containing protein 2-like [Phragmites australis]|uniref:AT-rich interactive domain-containing protein 2-like n=1 Tax=Phragmites australis TaxID=29695 RepID=UPI002D79F030|nr:AT-rich interactive domain-containing protein 2-like [Phragmites australis]